MNRQTAPLFEKIKTSKNLPSLPHILLKLIETCNNPDSTISDISQVIDKDSSLSAKVMRMVNSVHYGLQIKITSVEQALLLLGTDAVKNIAVSAAVFQVFGAAKGNGAFNLKAFWYHSMLCGTLAELVARHTGYDSPEEAFLTGLLHDIGKMVLWVNFPKDYTEILRAAETPEDMIASEQQRFGAHHGEVGAWIIGRWNLQSFMADAVLYHHEAVDDIKDALPLVKIVYLANTLCPYSGKINEVASINGKRLFDFAPSDINALISQGEEKVEQIALSLGMDIVAPESNADPDEEYEKEVDLLRNVRDLSLLQGTLQNLLQAYGQESILSVISQGLQVLFDVDPAIYLLYDPENNMLVGQEGTDPSLGLLVRELAVSLDAENTLPVQSLLQKTPLDSFGHLKPVDLSILDKQLIRLVNNDGILSLPMAAHGHPIGVMLLGVTLTALKALSQKMNLLRMFVDQSALALYADHVRQTQAKLIQQARLAAASSVARKIVHEVNNPLGIIKNYIKIFGLRLAKDDPAHNELGIIGEELDRVAVIIRGLSDFSEPQAKQTEPVNVNGLLESLVHITRDSFKKNANVTVNLEVDATAPMVFSHKNSLKQVFINLMKNAVEAMPNGGELKISTKYDAKGQDRVPTGIEGTHAVEIVIQDEGLGIPEDVRSRLFEPYVTTKEGNHVGLGLSIAYNIVKELNGSMTCESEKGVGAMFRITLPVGHYPGGK